MIRRGKIHDARLDPAEGFEHARDRGSRRGQAGSIRCQHTPVRQPTAGQVRPPTAPAGQGRLL